MTKVRKILAVFGLTIAALFFCTASAASLPVELVENTSTVAALPLPNPTPAPQNEVKQTPQGAAVASPGVLEQFGPPGVLLTTALTGILMIVRSINEGKKIDVTTYKERAADAEKRSDEEIGKVHRKLEEMNTKLDSVIADRDEYRQLLEDRKAHFSSQIIAQEKRHQKELEEVHEALMVELHVRHKMERILVENGLSIPETPPPYTRKMKAEVTPAEEQEVKANFPLTNEIPIVRDYQE